jgi:LysM repeat protein
LVGSGALIVALIVNLIFKLMTQLFLISVFSIFSTPDSLRLETIEGKSFVIHQVEKRETLFSISRRYGVAMSLVVDANPGSDSGIEIGELLKVPYSGLSRTQTRDGILHKVGERQTLYSLSKQYGVTVDELKSWNNIQEKDFKVGMNLLIKTKKTEKPAEIDEDIPDSKIHVVTEKQTLYSISKLYGVTVADVIRWNELKSNDLKTGQKLTIFSPDKRPLVEQNIQARPVEKTESIRIRPADNDVQNEKGVAMMIEGDDEPKKYLGYHRSIKPGSVIRVKNLSNQDEIFVRIVGPLSETESDQVIIRLSKAACERIGLQNKASVEVVYFK